MKKTIVLLNIFLLFIIIFSNTVFAASGYDKFVSFNNSPRVTFSAASGKYSDVTIKVKDYSKLMSVDLYKNGKKIKFSSSDVSNETEHIYTISHKKVLKGKTTNFKIVAKDKTGNTTSMEFTVKAKNKAYKFDLAPRVKNWTQSDDGKKVTFIVRDLGGVEEIKVKDKVSDEIVYQNKEKTPKGDYAITLNLSKCKVNKDGKYVLAINATDSYKKSNPRKISLTVNFKVTKSTIEEGQVKKAYKNASNVDEIVLNKNIVAVDELSSNSRRDYGNVNHRVAQLKVTNTNEEIKWSIVSGNQIAKVDQKGKVTGLNGGKAVVRAALKDNPSVYTDCEVTVLHGLYENVVTRRKVTAKILYNEKEKVKLSKGTKLVLHGILYYDKNTSKELTVQLSDGRLALVKAKDLEYKNYKIEKQYSDEIYTEYINNLGVKSKTKYLIFVSQGTQRLLLFQKDSNNKWVIKENEHTSTGDRETKGNSNIKYNLEVKDFKVDAQNPSLGRAIHVRFISDKKYYGNTIHVGTLSSQPISHGCPRITRSFRNKLFNKYSRGRTYELTGTRVIYY